MQNVNRVMSRRIVVIYVRGVRAARASDWRCSVSDEPWASHGGVMMLGSALQRTTNYLSWHAAHRHGRRLA